MAYGGDDDLRMEAVEADITRLRVDAIVNAANALLLGGGGVDGAIHRAAGLELKTECLLLGGCRTGEAKITGGYNLPARHIIHTVGPVWRGGDHDEDELLASCYRGVFSIARENRFETIAIPAISTGVYHFPLERATAIGVRETRAALAASEFPGKVIFACFSAEALAAYRQAIG